MAGVEVRSVQRHIRMSPQKVRLVLDVVRGKNAREALAILKFLPHRAARAVGTATVIAYTTVLPNHAVGVTYVALPPSASFSLDAGINGAAQSLPGAKIVSRNSLNYLGQPAEDATISSSAGLAQVRVVRFGSSAYVLQAFGPSASSYAHDYNILLDSFHPQNP